MEKNQIFIVIPAHNEEKTIGRLIKKLIKAGFENVIVVDDGSNDETFARAKEAGAEVLRLPINRGTGGALRTGFAHALKQDAEIVVMMDADLQHKVSDIRKLTAPIFKEEIDIVLGSRLMGNKYKMPLARRIANFWGNLVTLWILGLKVTDSQSGFRAIKACALEKMDLKSSRFEICSEIIGEIKRLGLSYKEIPISVTYTKYSLSKGQNLKNGLKTLARILAIRFR